MTTTGNRRMPTDTTLPLRRGFPRVAGAMLLAWLVGVGAKMVSGDPVVFITVTIVASILGVMVVIHSLGPQRAWIGIITILLHAIVPVLVVLVATEERAIGPILDVPAAQAPRHSLAAGFVFTDGAAPRADLRQVVTVVDRWVSRRGGPGSRMDTYVVAPIVPPGWTPDQPVSVVALVPDRHQLHRREPDHGSWSAPGGLLRLLDDDLQSRGVRDALTKGGFVRGANLVIGVWVPSPGWARVEAMLPGLAVIGTTLLAVLAMVAFDRLVPPRGTAPAPPATAAPARRPPPPPLTPKRRRKR
jgi:hypothetical protein